MGGFRFSPCFKENLSSHALHPSEAAINYIGSSYPLANTSANPRGTHSASRSPPKLRFAASPSPSGYAEALRLPPHAPITAFAPSRHSFSLAQTLVAPTQPHARRQSSALPPCPRLRGTLRLCVRLLTKKRPSSRQGVFYVFNFLHAYPKKAINSVVGVFHELVLT